MLKNNLIEITQQIVGKDSHTSVTHNDETVMYSLENRKATVKTNIMEKVRNRQNYTEEEHALKIGEDLATVLAQMNRKSDGKDKKKEIRNEKTKNSRLTDQNKLFKDSILYFSSIKTDDGRPISQLRLPIDYDLKLWSKLSADLLNTISHKSDQKWDNWKKRAKKYLWKITGKISCSFEWYKANTINFS